MTTRTIELSGRRIEYALKRSARRRTIGFRVGPEGLAVTIPSRTALRQAEAALQEKSGWILSKLDKWAARPAPSQLQGHDGEEIGYLGKTLRLSVLTHSRARSKVELTPEALAIHIDETLEGDLKAATVRRAVERWRRGEALALMTPKLHKFAGALDLDPPKVSVRVNSGRWGSCSSDGSIRMNARLIAHEESLIDYVCAHEACHLIEMNHGARFYALLDQIMPDHRKRSRALKYAIAPGAAY